MAKSIVSTLIALSITGALSSGCRKTKPITHLYDAVDTDTVQIRVTLGSIPITEKNQNLIVVPSDELMASVTPANPLFTPGSQTLSLTSPTADEVPTLQLQSTSTNAALCHYGEKQWEYLCDAFISGKDYRRKALSETFSSDIFLDDLSTVTGTVSYAYEGHSSPFSMSKFLDMAATLVEKAPKAKVYNLTNNGCASFNIDNYRALVTQAKEDLFPWVKGTDKKITVCGHQLVVSTPSTDSYTPSGSGKHDPKKKSDYTRLCIEVSGNNSQATEKAADAGVKEDVGNDPKKAVEPTLEISTVSACRIGDRCARWEPFSDYSYCRQGSKWSCQKCADDKQVSATVAECDAQTDPRLIMARHSNSCAYGDARSENDLEQVWNVCKSCCDKSANAGFFPSSMAGSCADICRETRELLPTSDDTSDEEGSRGGDDIADGQG